MIASDNPIYQQELEEICREDLPFHKLKNKNILITGATGLIGSYLIDVLLKINIALQLSVSVSALCRDEVKAQRRFRHHLMDVNFHIIQGNICEPIIVGEEWDYVIHCAGNNHPAVFAAKPVETMLISVLGTMNLLEQCKRQEKRIERFLFASTGEIYGEQVCQEEQGHLESDAGMVQTMNPRACYPEGKRAAETLCAAYHEEYGINTVIARLSYIYGPTFQENSSKADVQFIKQAVAGKNIILKSAGTQFRSYTYIADAAVGILYILLKGEAGEAYNIANPNSQVTIRELAEKLAEIAGVSIDWDNKEEAAKAGYSTMKEEILNASKLYKLGFTAKVDIEEGLKKTISVLTRNGK